MQGVQVRSLVREIDPTCHRSKIKTFLISIVFWYIFSLFSFFNNNQNSSMTWLSSCSQTMKNNLGSHAKKKKYITCNTWASCLSNSLSSWAFSPSYQNSFTLFLIHSFNTYLLKVSYKSQALMKVLKIQKRTEQTKFPQGVYI